MSLPQIFQNFRNLDDAILDRAFELLKLVEEAHRHYDAVFFPKDKKTGRRIPVSKNWDWENDISEAIRIDNFIAETAYPEYEEITKSPYQVLANLVFTQISWLSLRTGFKRKQPFGFIARKQGTSDIYIVFRGTVNVGEWISNLKFIQQSYTTIPAAENSPGETHWGFRRTYERPETYKLSKAEKRKILWVTRWFDQVFLRDARPIKNIVEETLIKECPSGTPKARIFVTGHSLGGALATVATSHIKKLILDKKISANLPILYTFASPRVGDEDFASSFSDLECYRIVNSEDIVPMVPLPTLLLAAGRTPPAMGTLALAQKLHSSTERRTETRSLTKKLHSSTGYQHIGLPIYFTVQNGNIAQNHTIPAYLEALKSLKPEKY